MVQVTVLTGMGEDRGQLLITRFDEGEDPATLHLPGFSTQQVSPVAGPGALQ